MTPTDLLESAARRARADAGASARTATAAVAAPTAPTVASVGVVAGYDTDGRPLIASAAAPDAPPVAARTIVPLDGEHVGREVVLLYEDNDPARPIVVGVLRPTGSPGPVPNASHPSVDVTVDGERVVLSAEREIVLRCGNASITLTRAGKVLITGEYVLTRARGVNRIRGGSVQIN